ncbi:very short patch repair endonuclease [Sinanaerobacter chloroacetimidivorans]|uniref:Very short patch repair endonuclease n=1 Tax=Sinanaerobacter chloroacetimidivorans TaxID=2818044 RepID=A0A8J8B1U2_9FIRM|nr:very short patch repair endonuclease [Sinanaerobacter chloroacetimidivorans]MBR0598599.1 DNA mismatch endonuclease Vsr [Sinanaerobacter chloroacetimidivorans]
MDIHSKETRSFNMSRIKSKNTKPEVLVRKYLFSLGLRFRINVTTLPGKPDIVLPKYKTIIFVHGCFWHGHENCKRAQLPKTRTEWWASKISANKIRDAYNIQKLIELGWSVITIWECQLNKADDHLKEIVDSIRIGC